MEIHLFSDSRNAPDCKEKLFALSVPASLFGHVSMDASMPRSTGMCESGLPFKVKTPTAYAIGVLGIKARQ
ncbi:hypothetical protein [Solemya velum gill symbiont]|uniref:hypothetical protein n=1 Tax=Solemya velum gill symbiont TaxID=2340 RepID=UPI001C4E05E1|nr:hypothetical protein [Solemya velum gill symbiont]